MKKLYIPSLILTAIVCIFLFSTLSYILVSAYVDDNFIYSVYQQNESLFLSLFINQSLEQAFEGHLSYFATRFFCFGLPCAMGINPADFITYGVGLFQGIFLFLLALSVSRFSNLYVKDRLLCILLSIFFCFWFFYTVINKGGPEFITNKAAFFRYPFILIFFNTYLFCLFKNLLCDSEIKKIDYKKIILIIINALILASNTEIALFISVITCVSVLMYYFIVNIIDKKIKSNKFKKSFQINIDKKSIIAISALFFSSIFYYYTVVLKYDMLSSRGRDDLHMILNNIPEYTQLYINEVFKTYAHLWLILIILFGVAFIFAVKKCEIKKVIVPVIPVFIIILFLYSLIICGKNYYGGGFWLKHTNIMLFCEYVMLIPIFALTGYVLSNLKNKYKVFIYTTIALIIVFIAGKLQQCVKSNAFNTKYDYIVVYMKEKMFRFYRLQNKIPVLIKTYNLRPVSFGDYGFIDKTKMYYYRVYHDKEVLKDDFKIEYSDDALEKYYNEGGSFSMQEIEEHKFEKLFDVDFVLNKENQKGRIKTNDDFTEFYE